MNKLFEIMKRHKKDVAVISLLLLAGILSLIFVISFGAEGTVVCVSVDGEDYGEYSLYLDGEYEIGEGNVLTVSGGEAYMSYADCPDHLCIKQGDISRTVEKIVCLPNRLSIEVFGTGEEILSN